MRTSTFSFVNWKQNFAHQAFVINVCWQFGKWRWFLNIIFPPSPAYSMRTDFQWVGLLQTVFLRRSNSDLGRYFMYSIFKISFLSAGTTFALVASLEVLDTLLASIIFNNIYSATVEWLPGFCYFLMSGLVVIPICLLLWVTTGLCLTSSFQPVSKGILNQLPTHGHLHSIHEKGWGTS